MSEKRVESDGPFDRLVAEIRRLNLEALLAGLDEDLGIAQVNLELNSLHAQLEEEPIASAS